jgi:hypothetical protein
MGVSRSPIFGTGFITENLALLLKHLPNFSKNSLSFEISSSSGILSSNGKLESYFFLFAGSMRVS